MAKASINTSYKSNRQLAFLEFVLGHYVEQGVDELDLDKLSPLLRLKYHAISDAAADLGTPEQIRNVFIGFRSTSIRIRVRRVGTPTGAVPGTYNSMKAANWWQIVTSWK